MATNYFWDEIEDNVIREYDENNTSVANYTTEPMLYGSAISQERSGETRFYHFDGQGNTTELTDESGNVTDTRRYSAFGEVTQRDGSTEFPYQFGGHFGYYHNGAAGQCVVRRRQYSNMTGRWASIDPTEWADSLNLFIYVHNNPIGFSDPTGLKTTTKEIFCPTSCNTVTMKCKFEVSISTYFRTIPLYHSPPPPIPKPKQGPLEYGQVFALDLRSSPAEPQTFVEWAQCGGCYGDFDRTHSKTDYIRYTLKNGTVCELTSANFGPPNPFPWTGGPPPSEECQKPLYFEIGIVDGFNYASYFFVTAL